MTARLTLARATVTTPNGETHERVGVTTRNGTLQVQTRQGLSLVDTTTTSVQPVDRKTWRIETPEGDYTVVRASGCGCG